MKFNAISFTSFLQLQFTVLEKFRYFFETSKAQKYSSNEN